MAECRAADLRLAVGGRFSEPTGQHSLSLTLTNQSQVACYLLGYPGVSLLDGANRPLPFDYKQSGDQVVTSQTPRRIDLASAGVAYVTINKYRCDLGDKGSAQALQLNLPEDSSALAVTLVDSSLGYCGPGDPGTTVSISPFEPTLSETLAH